MTKLPVVSGRQLAKALAQVGTALTTSKGATSSSGISPHHTVVSASRTIEKSPKVPFGRLFEKVA